MSWKDKPVLNKSEPLYEVYENFLYPIIKEMEGDGLPLDQKLNLAFGYGYRVIQEYRIVADIKQMPGVLADSLKDVNDGKILRRSFAAGDWRLLLRWDQRTPDLVEIEVFYGWNTKKSYIFLLTPTEFKGILDYIEIE